MNAFDWIIWSVGLVAYFFGFRLRDHSPVVSCAAMLFSLIVAAGLMLQWYGGFSDCHFFWLLPVASIVSLVAALALDPSSPRRRRPQT